MKDRINLLSNSVFMMFLGFRIEVFNKLLMSLFGKKKLIPLAWRIDSKLVKMRTNFSVLEKRHLALLESIVSDNSK